MAAAAQRGAPTVHDPSRVNMSRIEVVTDRLRLHLASMLYDTTDFCNLCLSLAKGVDYAVANNDIPPNVHMLPSIIMQLFQHKYDLQRHAAITVLVISIKNACSSGWFPEKQAEEVLTVANEMRKHYGSAGDINCEKSCISSTISQIMLRFYPHLQIGDILTYLIIEPGFGAYVTDFYIGKNLNFVQQGKIYLFVSKMDNTETPSSIISPPQVIFLLNGMGVDRRTKVTVDVGPQMPTNVTSLLNYGMNLLQVVGPFNDRYIIVIAFMMFKTCDASILQDYISPETANVDTDPDLIEGASRISLNCPLSFARINTPVKGHSCKHLQCFDFWNFMVVNHKRPSWRCPHCNQHVYYSDLRIDKKMLKVLMDVGENVNDVIISNGGSWKAVFERRIEENIVEHRSNNAKDMPEQLSDFSKATVTFLDLTGEDDELDVLRGYETEDIKPCVTSAQTSSTISVNPAMDSRYGSNLGFGASASRVVSGMPGQDFQRTIPSPLLTDATNLSLNQECAYDAVSQMPTTSLQGQLCPSDGLTSRTPVIPLQNQPSQFGGTSGLPTISLQNQVFHNDYSFVQRYRQFRQSYFTNDGGQASAANAHIGIGPMAVQALPAQTMPSVQQHSGTFLSQSSSGVSSGGMQCLQSVAPSDTAGANSTRGIFTNQPAGRVTFPQLQQFNQRHHTVIGGQLSQPASHASFINQQPGHQNLPTVAPSTTVSLPQMQGARNATPQQHMPRQQQAPSFTRAGTTGDQRSFLPMQVSRPADLVTEHSWRPAGRMRGSLSGRPIPAALSQLIIQPTPPSQSSQTPTQHTPRRQDIPPEIQAFVSSQASHTPRPGAI